jgi:hypothetical protein
VVVVVLVVLRGRESGDVGRMVVVMVGWDDGDGVVVMVRVVAIW